MNASLKKINAHELSRRLALAGALLLASFSVLLGISGQAVADTATAGPSACSSVAGPGAVAWPNTTRATAQDGSYSTTANFNNTSTQYLQCTGYNFAIPAGATIDGITVTVWRLASSNTCCQDAAMRLVKAGTIQTTDRSTTTRYPTTNTAEAHGGATDLWGGTWTVADINSANFGAAFAAKNTTTTNRTVSVDYIQITVNYTPLAVVSSMNLASANPSYAGNAVSWTVVFNTAVTGVNASDFQLVPGGGVSGASITSVTGSGTTWTVTANSGTSAGTLGLNLVDNDSIINADGVPLGGAGAGNGNFTGQVYTISPPFCTPPSNVPAGVTVSCQCDTFGRASLNPSTIFGGNWAVSTGATDTTGIVPYINSTTGLLRLTENTGNNAKAATVPGIFPAAGNYISVEFNDYAYNGSATGADGIAVTLSDYSVPAVPGGFGGSLGYAQRTDSTPNPPGFAGGWVGVALDEYGNYQNPTEGRVGGPGFIVQSVGVRGPGNGINGYRWVGGTASSPGGLRIDTANRTSTTPGPGYMYQVIVDARNAASGTINVSVNRDSTTMNGSSYQPLSFNAASGPSPTTTINAYTEANYALSQGWISQVVPNYWTISFTGSTGGSTNVHEIGGLRICAQTIIPPTGGTASGFSAIDEAYPAGLNSTAPAYANFQTGHIYMKLVGTSFKLWVAALTGTGISTGYSSTSAKYVQVKLVDNSDNACGLDSARTCNSTCTNKTAVEAGATQIATFASGATTGVASPSPTFTLNSAWKDLIAVMKECTTSTCTAFTATTPACSVDSFSVRPTSFTSVTSANATNTGASGTPTFTAGAGNFSLTATAAGIGSNPGGYIGVPQINSASVQVLSPATIVGTLAGTFPAATSGTGNSTATGTTFTYSEVGGFLLLAPDFTVPRIPGVYDNTWTAIDSDPTKNDCNSGTTAAAYSNTKDANGKYGCNFGITANTGGFGRFIPHHFDVTKIHGCTGGATFTYSGQPFTVTATARNSAGGITQNYHGAYGLSKDTTISNAGVTTNFTPNNNTSNNNLLTAANFINGVRTQSTVTYTFPVTSPPKETAPATLTLRAIDTDGVSSAGYTEEQAQIRSGRVRIQNAYGSELVALPVPMRVEYYEDTTITAPATNPPVTGWITNNADTCTSIPATGLSLANNVAPSPVTPPTAKNIGSKTTQATVATPLFFNGSGDAGLSLSAPGQGGDGYVDITADLSAKTWLRFDWNGTGSDIDPTGRATFGLYRGSPKHIYLRQRYN